MSILEGAINTLGPVIDKRLDGKLTLLTIIPIEERIKILLCMSFFGVAEQLEHDGSLGDITRVNCFVTEYGDVNLKLDGVQEAIQMAIIIYPVKKWLDNNRTDIQILTCIIEELCHHYWRIEDEVQVNYKVLEVIKRILPKANIQMSDLYNIDWMEENKS